MFSLSFAQILKMFEAGFAHIQQILACTKILTWVNWSKIAADFVIIKDGKKCFMQVLYLLSDDEVTDREFKTFDSIGNPS